MLVTGRGAMARKDNGAVLGTWDFTGLVNPQEIACPQGVADADLDFIQLDDYSQEEYYAFIEDHSDATYNPTRILNPYGSRRGTFMRGGDLHPVEVRYWARMAREHSQGVNKEE